MSPENSAFVLGVVVGLMAAGPVLFLTLALCHVASPGGDYED